ncbi:MAG: hypothetical protein ACQER3_08620 [Pseudomonadota bacterium]|nr:hypothetical protein [Serratia fonticola]
MAKFRINWGDRQHQWPIHAASVTATPQMSYYRGQNRPFVV